MRYRVGWRELWQYPLCGVLVTGGAVLGVASAVKGEEPGLALAALVCAGSGMLLHMHLSRRQQEQKPIQAVRAKVLYGTKGRWVGSTYYAQAHSLTFETETGETLELQVSELDYNRWETGDEGLLRYREGEFLSFGRGGLTGEDAEHA